MDSPAPMVFSFRRKIAAAGPSTLRIGSAVLERSSIRVVVYQEEEDATVVRYVAPAANGPLESTCRVEGRHVPRPWAGADWLYIPGWLAIPDATGVELVQLDRRGVYLYGRPYTGTLRGADLVGATLPAGGCGLPRRLWVRRTDFRSARYDRLEDVTTVEVRGAGARRVPGNQLACFG